MPVFKRTIDYYSCQFKCGSPVKDKYRMEQHEKVCFCNPENKACRICANFLVQPYRSKCNALNLYIVNNDKMHSVYDGKDRVVWEYFRTAIFSEFEEIKPRPFPTKNCTHFVLGKKNY